MEADADRALEILKREFQARSGAYDAEDLFDRIEDAGVGVRHQAPSRLH